MQQIVSKSQSTILSVIFYFSFPAFSSSSPTTYQETETGSEKKVYEYNTVNVSDLDFCRANDCIAVVCINKKSFPSEGLVYHSDGRNPASLVCESIGGKPKIFKMDNRDEVAVCKFSDGSFLDTWQYINLVRSTKGTTGGSFGR